MNKFNGKLRTGGFTKLNFVILNVELQIDVDDGEILLSIRGYPCHRCPPNGSALRIIRGLFVFKRWNIDEMDEMDLHGLF